MLVCAGVILADTLIWMVRAWSATPYWDQWATVAQYRDYRLNGPSWALLLSQHNEHRLAAPRLLFLLDYLAGGANRVLFPLLILLQVGHAAMLTAIGARRGETWLGVVLGATCLALMTSLGQLQNLTWGFQIQFVGVFAAGTGGFWLLAKATVSERTGHSWRARLADAIVLFVVATCTMANGLLSFAVGLALALALRASWRVLAILVGVFALTAVLFLIGYKSTGSLIALVEHPVAVGVYVANYLGSLLAPLYQSHVEAARPGAAPSMLGLLGFALAVVASVRGLMGAERNPMRLVLLAVMAFVLAGAVVTAAGRIGFGPEQALSSRYVTPAAVFWSAQLFYWSGVASETVHRRRAQTALALVCAALMAALLTAQVRVKPELILQIAKINLGGDALRTGVVDLTAFADVAEVPAQMADLAPFLRDKHLATFAEADSAWLGLPLSEVLGNQAAAGVCAGAFDGVENVSEGAADAVRVKGWAWNRRADREASRILLVDGRRVIVGFATADAPRPDVPASLPWVRTPRAGWDGYALTPPGANLTAIAVLPGGGFCEIGQRRYVAEPAMVLHAMPPGAPDRPLEAPVVKDQAWTLGGQGPLPAASETEGAFGSWSGADAKVGSLTFGPLTATSGRLSFSIATGPSSQGQSLSVRDAQSGVVFSSTKLRRRDTWSRVYIEIPAGRPMFLTAVDAGDRWGQWMAITAPREPPPTD